MKKLLLVGLLFIAGFGTSACQDDCGFKDAFQTAGQWVSFTDCVGPDHFTCYQAGFTSDITKKARGPITVSSTNCENNGGGGGGGGGTVGLICPPAWYGGQCMTLDQFIDSFAY